MSDNNKQKNRIVNTSLLLLLSGFIISIVLLACVPPTSRDALIHHLQIPKLYLNHNGIYEIPDLFFSYYPMNLDLLYMGALFIGNDILPKYIHMAFGLATAFLLYSYLKERLPRTYAYLGALFFLSIPIIVKLSITVYVDLGLVFFTTASLLLLFQWIERDFKSRYLILAGICCGLAVGTKYNGLLVLFLLTIFIPVLYIKNTRKKGGSTATALQVGALFFFCAILAASPWFIRNGIWTGNPIYPLYDGFFNPSTTASTGAAIDKNNIRGVFATRYVLYGEDIWQLLLLPVRIFFQGMDNDPRYFDGRLNPFLLLLPIFGFMRGSMQDKRLRMEKVTLLVFCLLYFLFAFNTGVLRIRYLAPMIPLLVILAMYGLHNIELFTKQYATNRNIVTMAWLLLVGLMFASNGMYIYQQFRNIDPLSYISGRLSRDEYLIKYRPEYKVMQYANTNLPNSAKILCVFLGRRGYYLDRDHVFDHYTNSKWLLSWLKESDITENEIAHRLQERGISHLLIRTDLFSQWLQQTKPAQQALWYILGKNHFSPVASYLNYTLYQVNFPQPNEQATIN